MGYVNQLCSKSQLPGSTPEERPKMDHNKSEVAELRARAGTELTQAYRYSVNHLQFPTDVILLVVLWRLRYKPSLRDLSEMFLVRGFEFTHEAVRDWETGFAPRITELLRARRSGTIQCEA